MHTEQEIQISKFAFNWLWSIIRSVTQMSDFFPFINGINLKIPTIFYFCATILMEEKKI